MGYGLKVAAFSREWINAARGQLGLIITLLLTMYITDAQYWPVTLQFMSCFIIFFLLCLALCSYVAIAPYGPISVFTILVPASIGGIKNGLPCFHNAPAHVLVGTYHAIYILLGTIVLMAFAYWCKGNFWDAETNAFFSHAVGCVPDFDELDVCRTSSTSNSTSASASASGITSVFEFAMANTESNTKNVSDIPCFFDEDFETITFSRNCTSYCIDVYESCDEAFVIWAFPGLAAMALFVMGFIAKFLENPRDPQQFNNIGTLAKAFVIFLFIFWIFASIVGAGEGLTNSLIAFAFSICIGSGIVFSVVFWNRLAASSRYVYRGISRKAKNFADLLRGLVVLALSPVVLVYLALSVVNQFVRRYCTRRCFRSRMENEEYAHSGCFTLAVDKQIRNFFTWDHVKVLSYAVYCGIGYLFIGEYL